MATKVKVGDILELDREENLETTEELAQSLASYSDIELNKELLDWCKQTLDNSFKVEQVVYNKMFYDGSTDKKSLKNKIFYDEQYRELNIPTPFDNVWLTIPIETLTKIDVS